MSRAFSLAGFEVTLIGRFWVTPEALALGGLSRKTIANILLTLFSLLRTGKAWEYAPGSILLWDLTLPHDGVKKSAALFHGTRSSGYYFRCVSEPRITSVQGPWREPYRSFRLVVPPVTSYFTAAATLCFVGFSVFAACFSGCP